MASLCLAPRCANLATYRGRCPTHAQIRNKETSPNRHHYHLKRWRLLRRRILFDNPLCATPGCTTIATDVDHIIPIKNGGAIWDPDNLQALCRSHHASKTRTEQQSRAVSATTPDIGPIDQSASVYAAPQSSPSTVGEETRREQTG